MTILVLELCKTNVFKDLFKWLCTFYIFLKQYLSLLVYFLFKHENTQLAFKYISILLILVFILAIINTFEIFRAINIK